MRSCRRVTALQLVVQELANYLNGLYTVINSHMVDFLTKDHWTNILPTVLRSELDSLPKEQLLQEVNSSIFQETEDDKQRKYELFNFIQKARSQTLSGLSLCSELSDVIPPLDVKQKTCLPLSKWWMKRKKSHEVEIMANVVASIVQKHGIRMVVDFGCGKGYLSSFLAHCYHLNILGIDSSSGNTCSASCRNTRLSAAWEKECKRQVSHLLSEIQFHNSFNDLLPLSNDKDGCLQDVLKTKIHELCSTGNTAENFGTNNDTSNAKISSKDYRDSCTENITASGHFYPVTCFVNKHTDLQTVIADFISRIHYNDKMSETFEHNFQTLSCVQIPSLLFCGLHTCGNLASSLVKHFVSTTEAQALCCVGCCYHLIEEEFFRKSLQRNEGKLEEFGFPISSFLREKQFRLGRNARMLASQSLDRAKHSKKAAMKIMFCRAVLQVILQDHGVNLSEQQVGRAPPQCENFVDYVHKALSKLHLNIQISDDGIKKYEAQFAEDENRLYAFQQLRILLSPCIEAMLILDKLLFLYEQDCVEEARVMRFFDPVTSPRCYGIVALKSQGNL